MHPLQFRHLAHLSHHALGSHMQRVEVVAIEAELQLGHLQQVEALELHVSLGECL